MIRVEALTKADQERQASDVADLVAAEAAWLQDVRPDVYSHYDQWHTAFDSLQRLREAVQLTDSLSARVQWRLAWER
jgi:hypothetical protein